MINNNINNLFFWLRLCRVSQTLLDYETLNLKQLLPQLLDSNQTSKTPRKKNGQIKALCVCGRWGYPWPLATLLVRGFYIIVMFTLGCD